MRPERSYLQDIVNACDEIEGFCSGESRQTLENDHRFQSAVLYQLSIIGEAASRLSRELRSKHPEVDWRQIASMRNFVVHAYFSVDLDIVWETVTVDVPKLRAAVLKVAEDEFPQGHI